MIILDTDVILETQKVNPDPQVMEYLNQLEQREVYVTSITMAEVIHEVDILPPSVEKNHRENCVFRLFKLAFDGRVLPFNDKAAAYFALMLADAKRHKISTCDIAMMKASISAANYCQRYVTGEDLRCGATHAPIIENPWVRVEKKSRWKIAGE